MMSSWIADDDGSDIESDLSPAINFEHLNLQTRNKATEMLMRNMAMDSHKATDMLRTMGNDLGAFLWETTLYEYSDKIQANVKNLQELLSYSEHDLNGLIQKVDMRVADAERLRECLHRNKRPELSCPKDVPIPEYMQDFNGFRSHFLGDQRQAEFLNEVGRPSEDPYMGRANSTGANAKCVEARMETKYAAPVGVPMTTDTKNKLLETHTNWDAVSKPDVARSPILQQRYLDGGNATLVATAFRRHRTGAEIIKESKPDSFTKPGLCGAEMTRAHILATPQAKRDKAQITMLAAVKVGNLDAIRKLVKEDSSAVRCRDGKDQTPLIIASTYGHLACLEALLDANAAPNEIRSDQRTALMIAADKGHAQCVALLLRHAANVNQVVTDPMQPGHGGSGSALVLACTRGQTECVKSLLEHGADVEATDAVGRTSLMLASFLGYRLVLELLINGGANVNAKLENGSGGDVKTAALRGRTAFHWACLAGHLECVKALILADCDIQMIDCEKRTGHDLAASKIPTPGSGKASRGPSGKRGIGRPRDFTKESSSPHASVIKYLDQRAQQASDELLKLESQTQSKREGLAKETDGAYKRNGKESKKQRQKQKRADKKKEAAAQRADAGTFSDLSSAPPRKPAILALQSSGGQSANMETEGQSNASQFGSKADCSDAVHGVDACPVEKQRKNGEISKKRPTPADSLRVAFASLDGLIVELETHDHDLAHRLHMQFNAVLAERTIATSAQTQLSLDSGTTTKGNGRMHSEKSLQAWSEKYAGLQLQKEAVERRLEQQSLEFSGRIEEAWRVPAMAPKT
jgi:ankyrin repeat protein